MEYLITLEGRKDQENMRAENPGLDGERGVNVDDLLEESQEREENQAKITLEDPHGQETGGVEDPDPGGRSGEEIQELHAPQPRHQKPDRKTTKIGSGRTRSQGRNPTYKRQGMKSTDTVLTQKPRQKSAVHTHKRQGTKKEIVPTLSGTQPCGTRK